MPRPSDPNRACSDEVEHLGVTPRSPRKRRRKSCPEAPRKSPRGKRLRTEPEKLAILKDYIRWTENGKRKADSPISRLVLKYRCHKNYPKELYDKVKQYGSVASRFGAHRPEEFQQDTWDQMVEMIREIREDNVPASGRKIRTLMIKAKLDKVPAVRTINLKKAALGFRVFKLKDKPLLNADMMKKRLEYANWLKNLDMSRVVVIDEKQFTEQKQPGMVTARRLSPLKKRFRGKQHETGAQLSKVMFLAAVTENHKILCTEFKNVKEFNKKIAKQTGKREKRGITADYMLTVFQKLRTEAVRCQFSAI